MKNILALQHLHSLKSIEDALREKYATGAIKTIRSSEIEPIIKEIVSLEEKMKYDIGAAYFENRITDPESAAACESGVWFVNEIKSLIARLNEDDKERIAIVESAKAKTESSVCAERVVLRNLINVLDNSKTILCLSSIIERGTHYENA